MARPLLISEMAILEGVVSDNARERKRDWRVLHEYYSLPKRNGAGQWFNTDFTLELQEPLPSERTISVVPVREQTVGAEVFVVLSQYGDPARVELLGGDSIPVDAFRDEIQVVNELLKSINSVPMSFDIRSTKFLRMIHLRNSISFAAFNSTEVLSRVNTASTIYECHFYHLSVRVHQDNELLVEGFVDSP